METTSGWQLNFVALKIHKPADHVQPLRLKDLVPHVTGSLPMFGSWDPSGAESTNRWELSFVVPADHGNLCKSTNILPSLLLAEILE
ncbi:unnamed protein product [Sphagnum jensenii]|uniref:Uncharacterized protein n=1 Tax=Sphagnum jensenii TaxID=128206 RepID=A0ABP1AC10_9BRYO